MIHPRRGGGTGGHRLLFALFAVCLAVALVALASGQVELGLQVPWKGLVTLAVVGLLAAWSRLRRRAAARR